MAKEPHNLPGPGKNITLNQVLTSLIRTPFYLTPGLLQMVGQDDCFCPPHICPGQQSEELWVCDMWLNFDGPFPQILRRDAGCPSKGSLQKPESLSKADQVGRAASRTVAGSKTR